MMSPGPFFPEEVIQEEAQGRHGPIRKASGKRDLLKRRSPHLPGGHDEILLEKALDVPVVFVKEVLTVNGFRIADEVIAKGITKCQEGQKRQKKDDFDSGHKYYLTPAGADVRKSCLRQETLILAEK